jgi:hypothetical protein
MRAVLFSILPLLLPLSGAYASECIDDESVFLGDYAQEHEVIPCTPAGKLFLYGLGIGQGYSASDLKVEGFDYYFPARSVVRLIDRDDKSANDKITAIFGLSVMMSSKQSGLDERKKSAYLAFLIGRYWELAKGGGGPNERIMLKNLLTAAVGDSGLPGYKAAKCAVLNDWPGRTLEEIVSAQRYVNCLEE